MVKSKFQVFLGLLVAATALFVLYQHYFPNPEKVIRNRLLQLAAAVSAPVPESTAVTLVAADRLRDFLASEVVVEADGPKGNREIFSGRQEVLQAAIAGRKLVRSLRVEFSGINIRIAPDRLTATAELTARVTQDGDQEYTVQEFKMELRQEDHKWRITRAESVRTLRL